VLVTTAHAQNPSPPHPGMGIPNTKTKPRTKLKIMAVVEATTRGLVILYEEKYCEIALQPSLAGIAVAITIL
jgi:hypothetical protein